MEQYLEPDLQCCKYSISEFYLKAVLILSIYSHPSQSLEQQVSSYYGDINEGLADRERHNMVSNIWRFKLFNNIPKSES